MHHFYLFPNSTALFQHIFVSLTKKNIANWSEELQLECGSGLLTLITRGSLQDSLKLECIQLSLTFLSFYSRTLHSRWLPVYSALLPQLSLQTIKSKLVPEIMLLSDCSQKAIIREVSVFLLAQLAAVVGKEFKGPLVQRVKALSQDPSSEVREAMAKNWIGIIRVLGKTALEETFFFDVLKLADDENLQVRIEGVRLLLMSLEFVSEGFFGKEVSQVVRNIVFSDNGEKIESVICENIGNVVAGCYGQFKNEFLRLILRLVAKEANRKNIAFNYPGLVQLLGLSNEIKEVALVLSESSTEVLIALAKGFHEVVAINKHCKILKKISNKLVEDNEARVIIFKKLDKWCKVLETSALLLKFTKFLTLPLDWRTQSEMFQVFIQAFPSFNLKEVLDHFVPLILHKMLTACWPVKQSACAVLCHILTQTFYTARKLDICNIVKEKLGKSLSSYDRVLFIEFCEVLAEKTSKKFFTKYFLADYLNITFDKSLNVLVKFMESCYSVSIYGYIYNIQESVDQLELKGSLEELKKHLIVFLKSHETEVMMQNNLQKDKLKENFETQLEGMEVKENESFKKRAADEMALKASLGKNEKMKKMTGKGRMQSESIDPKARSTRSTALLKLQGAKKK